MAKGRITTYNADEAANVNLGQIGCAVHTDSDATDNITPPTGCVIVAITVLEANTNIDSLIAEDPTRWANTASAAHETTSHVEDSLHGTGGETFPTAVNLYSGMSIYGRWTSVSVSAGSVIAYFGK